MTFRALSNILLHGVDLEELVDKIPKGEEYYIIYCSTSDNDEWKPHKIVFTEFEMKQYVEVMNDSTQYQRYSMNKMTKN